MDAIPGAEVFATRDLPHWPPSTVAGHAGRLAIGAAIYAGKVQPFQHLVSAWSTRTGQYLPAFPRLVEDWMFLTAPALADVGGDGRPEILIGNGAGWVHAFGADL